MMFMARGEVDGIMRTVAWREYPDGRAEPRELHQLISGAGGVEVVEVVSRRLPRRLVSFPNVTALLTAVGIPTDAERIPMCAGDVSTSP